MTFNMTVFLITHSAWSFGVSMEVQTFLLSTITGTVKVTSKWSL